MDPRKIRSNDSNDSQTSLSPPLKSQDSPVTITITTSPFSTATETPTPSFSPQFSRNSYDSLESLPSFTLGSSPELTPPFVVHTRSRDSARTSSPRLLSKNNAYPLTQETPEEELDSGWIDSDKYKISINKLLYDTIGVVALRELVKRQADLPPESRITHNKFTFGSSSFQYGDICDITPTHGEKISSLKTNLLMEKLQTYSNERDPTSAAFAKVRPKLIKKHLLPIFTQGQEAQEKSIREARSKLPSQPDPSKRQQKKQYQKTTSNSNTASILRTIQDYAEEKNMAVIYRESSPSSYDHMLFSPFVMSSALPNGSLEKIALRIHPWTSDGTIDVFEPVKKFVTACCIFGGGMEGQDGEGASFPLIKHEINFFPGQKIKFIRVKESLYEEAQFETFKALNLTMQRLGDTNFEVICHLPYIDYILFGVRLYLEGKMTLEAFEVFCEEILIKKDELSERLNTVFSAESRGKLTIASPFDNLFGPIQERNGANIAALILEKLELAAECEAPSQELGENETKSTTQEEVVQRCLNLVMTNAYDEEHATAWRDLIKTADKVQNELTTLEELFKLANIIIPRAASKGMSAYQVCSLLPYSEYQISKGVSKYKDIPPHLNITYFDLVIAFDYRDLRNAKKHAGIPFYFNANDNKGQKLIKKGFFFKSAIQNGACTSDDPRHIPLQQQLSSARK